MNSEQLNATLIRRGAVGSRIAAFTVIGIGQLVMPGWALDNALLKSLLPGLATMKFNSALSFVLGGTALMAYHGGSLRLACVPGAAVVLVGLLTLAEYLFGWSLGIDQ